MHIQDDCFFPDKSDYVLDRRQLCIQHERGMGECNEVISGATSSHACIFTYNQIHNYTLLSLSSLFNIVPTASHQISLNDNLVSIFNTLVKLTELNFVKRCFPLQNGSLANEGGMPLRNTKRVPLFNNPVPHYMRMLSPERLFRK